MSRLVKRFKINCWRKPIGAKPEPIPSKICIAIGANPSSPHYARDFVRHAYGSGSKPKACNKAGAHTRDIPRYKGYVTGARLARQAFQYHEYEKCFIAARQRATRGM